MRYQRFRKTWSFLLKKKSKNNTDRNNIVLKNFLDILQKKRKKSNLTYVPADIHICVLIMFFTTFTTAHDKYNTVTRRSKNNNNIIIGILVS